MNLDAFEIIGEFLGTEDGLATVQGVREVLDGLAVLLNDDPPDVGGFHEAVPYRDNSLPSASYLGGAADLVKDPRVSPILKATQLPPGHIAVGSADALIEDAEALRATLARAGKVHDFHVYEDMPHAFMQMEFLDEAPSSVRRMTDFLHSALET